MYTVIAFWAPGFSTELLALYTVAQVIILNTITGACLTLGDPHLQFFPCRQGRAPPHEHKRRQPICLCPRCSPKHFNDLSIDNIRQRWVSMLQKGSLLHADTLHAVAQPVLRLALSSMIPYTQATRTSFAMCTMPTHTSWYPNPPAIMLYNQQQ